MSQSHSSILLTNPRGGYEPLDEEFQVTDADWKWLLTHTEYTEPELRDMLHGEELCTSPISSSSSHIGMGLLVKH